jgi:hypothetical protein
MTLEQQRQLAEELTLACESENVDTIMDVMNRHYSITQTCRSAFCVADEKHEKEFLPPHGPIASKAYLHSFMTSRRILTVKNPGTKSEFRYTHTISLDTNFASYLRRRCSGASCGAEIDACLTECLKFLAPYRSGMDITLYLYENAARLSTPQVFETIEAYMKLRHADPVLLESQGLIQSNLADKQIRAQVHDMIKTLKGDDWQALSDHAEKNWASAYVVLLAAAAVQLAHGTKSSARRIRMLLEFLDKELGFFPQQELYFVHRFFERGNNEGFFRQVQSNAKELTDKLSNMAWDLAHPRTVLDQVSAVARGNADHAEFVVPYILTFDLHMQRLFEGFQMRGLVTYINNGAKHLCIFPQSVSEGISESLSGCDEFFTAERQQARMIRGKAFKESKERRREVIELAIENLRILTS